MRSGLIVGLLMALAVPAFAAGSSSQGPVGGVCAYVADAWNQGRGHEISADSGTVVLHGVSHPISVSSGSCYAGVDIGDAKSTAEARLPGVPESDPSRIDIVRFQARDYVVFADHAGPYAIYDPATGPVCDVRRIFTPVLTTNHSRYCPAFAAHRLKASVPFSLLPAPLRLKRSWAGDVTSSVDATAQVKISPAGPILAFGHYSSEGFFPCGSEGPNGVVLMDGAKESKAPIARSFNNRFDATLDGRLLRVGGRIFAEGWGDIADPEQTKFPAFLLAYQEGGFDVACEVKQRITYAPAPPTTDQSGRQ